ncbi:alanyl-tRNA synthetase [Catenulispora acidiphila DSM 44928]|uniref:Alanine--tRNA ligase n=1 Tax=Catenulispora acidiphila (strain DSM 44928 / JCM 14897 / NBRC 102108 / NRRL B-24433 / ID139908) TaxID=479433 RepID=C7PVQ4_CATAD|nr:alanine--tRNA ligase [Catenulispora acidiphila]ACU71296.1 alanyl-tRNA synthetase [Catenulispora acidiphila DSM 44928]
MESAEIHRRWLDFFQKKGHTVVPSASLISNDPTTLLTIAGMAPFKPYFLGEQPAPWPRATSVQKCVRTLDIEEVGKTTRHGSFFQMCGNFSFGDYFKETAIPMAWELCTTPVSEGGFGLDPEKIWVTVYLDDDEAEEIWKKAGFPAERIQRLGMKENYWSMGVPGPCGPCSELFYDRGPEFGEAGGPAVNDERYMEFWNLVFMQFERGAGGDKGGFPILGELPSKSIDTGLGLERLATILQGVNNLYEIDTSRAILDKAASIAGVTYGRDTRTDVSLRVVTDHVKTATMMIGDGITPGNEGRGYVLRRLMRRAIRNMRLLGAHGATIKDLVEITIGAMGQAYPELIADASRIVAVAVAEETSFLQTLRTGSAMFETVADEAKASGSAVFSGDQAFKLHDTFGFPIDLTLEMASEAGLSVDEEGFRRLMKEQRDQAKADARAKKTGHADMSAYRELLDAAGPSAFTGYHEVSSEGLLKAMLVNGQVGSSAKPGDEVELVLDRTPFYAEGGGQLADHGLIRLGNGALAEVVDVQKPVGDLIAHRAIVRDGEVVLGAEAWGEVDTARRAAISRAHTATHMVHKAFRELLGETATQAGSENSPGRFRFDFASPGAVPHSVLADVEQRVNELLIDDLSVTAQVMSQPEAKAMGAMALFGEKYGDRVRVVSVGEWAHELCGGTHVDNTGRLGLVKLLSESSIGSGVRRVEALVGTDAYNFLAREHVLVSQLAEVVKARPEELVERVGGIMTKLRDAEKEISALKAGQLLQIAGSLVDGASDVHGVAVVTHQAPDGASADDLRKLVLDVRGRLGTRPAVVAVAAAAGERPVVVIATNEGSRGLGLKAGELVRSAAKTLGGGGGGKDDVAQGGGTDATAIPAALEGVGRAVAEKVAA